MHNKYTTNPQHHIRIYSENKIRHYPSWLALIVGYYSDQVIHIAIMIALTNFSLSDFLNSGTLNTE